MKSFITTILCLLVCVCVSSAQSIQDIIDQVDFNELSLTVQEFSGEQSTVVDGNTVTILNRQQANNDLAADYLVQRFEALDNITITDQAFNSNGRNIIATQTGLTNPNDIYIVCAHYDTVADFCADDNATGTAAVLEIARLLSTQCLDNTVVYALWDEEETSLGGSEFYADQAATNGDNILGVINLDMIGYDGDASGQPGDNEFDIDVRDVANSLALKDDIITVLNSYTFDLSVITVQPGTFFSDHASFWVNGYSAVLLGESWETNDQTPFYHTSGDQFSTLDLQYFHEMTKLTAACMATFGGLVNLDNTVTQTATMLTSNQSSATYQWINCNTDTPISGAVGQSYTPSANGNYAVEVTSGSCTEISECIVFDTLELEAFSVSEVNLFPNPVSSKLTIEVSGDDDTLDIDLFDVGGKLLLQNTLTENNTLDMSSLSSGIYFLKVSSSDKTGTYKVVKE